MDHVIYTVKPLGNPRFRWKQRKFALSTFNCIGEDMPLTIKNCINAGFNLLELGWATHEQAWEAVEVCEKLGIGLIFQDLSVMGGMMHRHMNRPVDDNEIRRIAGILKEKKHTVGYYVWDEPYQDVLFTEARRQSDILLECDPDALLFSVFPPSYNPGPTWDNGQYAEAFEEYVRRLDPPVLSMDSYPIGDYCKIYEGLEYTEEMQLDDSPMWLDLTLARNLARKYGLPFWFYYQCCGVYNTKHLDFNMVRMMMYAGVLYGAKGLQSYTLTGTCGLHGEEGPSPWSTLLLSGHKGVFFDEQKKIHGELNALGNTLLALENRAVYHSADLQPFDRYGDIYKNYREDISDSLIVEGPLPDRTSVSEFTDAFGNTYLMILNRDFYRTLETRIPLKDAFHIFEVSREDGKQYLRYENAGSIPVTLCGGDALLLRLQPAGDMPFTVEYKI